MNKYIQKLIREQFNIGKMDLNNNSKSNFNIFNKKMIDPYEIYDMIINGKQDKIIPEDIKLLNDILNDVKIESKVKLKHIVMFYSYNYPEDSMNWLNVSAVTDMDEMFRQTAYNGDISQWDVSNVTTMSGMFMSSSFNGDIGNWDVSNVTDMLCMFNCSPFN